MFLYDVLGILILVLLGAFLLSMPLAAAGSLVWTFGKVANVKARIEAHRFVARQRGSKAIPLGMDRD
ncbi:MAG TPA: hypothetical protein VGL91_13755 [Acidobacteriota bacterium]|jgi:uncharacterized membrane protein